MTVNEFSFQKIEKKWQKKWQEEKIFEVKEDMSKNAKKKILHFGDVSLPQLRITYRAFA